MNQIERLTQRFDGEVGTVEVPANSNRQKYGKAYGWDGVSWCVQYIWWGFAEEHLQSLFYGGKKTASCGQLKTFAENKGCWVTSGYRKGDLVIMDFSGNSTVTDHIGFVYEVKNGVLHTIEGNTSSDNKGSQNNGGGVWRKTRDPKKVKIVGAYRPPYTDIEEDFYEDMKIIKGETASEKKMIKATQTAVGAIADGEIGTQTMSDLAVRVSADCFPITLEIYKMPVIIAKDIVPFSPSDKLSKFKNSISGSFLSGTTPCSIMVADGKTISGYACHSHYDKPETVIYRLENGKFGITRAMSADELPEDTKWAVGGLGLLNFYDPNAEGFCKVTKNGRTENFSDVLRDTNHTMLGVKNNMCYMVYCKSMTAKEVNAFAKKLGLEKAIMLDGGHVAAIYGEESFAKINTSQKQYYAIKGV